MTRLRIHLRLLHRALHALGALAVLWLVCIGPAVQASPIIHDPTQPEKRLALLIGNADYTISPLTNPENDVNAMEAVLKKAGFRVIKGLNMKRREMARVIREFGEELKRQGGVGLFYYAGHGLQVRGVNYLVPVDAQIKHEDEVALDSVDAQMVLEKMLDAKNRVNVVILDACRNNPFTRSRSAVSGLAKMEAPVGSIVAYSTAPGSVASDGSGNNGLYTEHLIQHMTEPGLSVEDVFKKVRAAVRRASSGRQIPWESTALEADFVFFPPGMAPPVIALPPPKPAGGSVQVAAAQPVPVPVPMPPPAAVVQAAPPAAAPAPAPAPAVQAAPMPSAAAAAQAGLAQSQVSAAPVLSPNPQPPAPMRPPAPLALRPPPPPEAPPPPAAQAPQGLRLPSDPRAPIPLAALREATRVPVSSMSVAPQVLATGQAPAAAAPADAGHTTVAAVGNRRYEVLDSVNQQRRQVVVGVNNLPDGWRRLSDGTEIHADGRVRRLALGQLAVRASARAGALFKLPLDASTNGTDTVEVTNDEGRPVVGRWSWTARQIGAHVVINATVDAISFVVNYRAWYAPGEAMPERFEVEAQDRLTRKLTQNLSARQVVTN